jgi:hypothetical protein
MQASFADAPSWLCTTGRPVHRYKHGLVPSILHQVAYLQPTAECLARCITQNERVAFAVALSDLDDARFHVNIREIKLMEVADLEPLRGQQRQYSQVTQPANGRQVWCRRELPHMRGSPP